MKETIYTIPITEVFEPRKGCPLCALQQTLETRWVEYITGAAMMEPDVRIETNRRGFCARHFGEMLTGRNRLSVALMLQSRLEHLQGEIGASSGRNGFFSRKAEPEADGCFLCEHIEGELFRIAGNVAKRWGEDATFRELFGSQEYLCLPHYRLLFSAASPLRGSSAGPFREAAAALTRKALDPLKGDIDAFCNLFDYRNAGSGAPSPEVARAIERAVAYHAGMPDFWGQVEE